MAERSAFWNLQLQFSAYNVWARPSANLSALSSSTTLPPLRSHRISAVHGDEQQSTSQSLQPNRQLRPHLLRHPPTASVSDLIIDSHSSLLLRSLRLPILLGRVPSGPGISRSLTVCDRSYAPRLFISLRMSSVLNWELWAPLIAVSKPTSRATTLKKSPDLILRLNMSRFFFLDVFDTFPTYFTFFGNLPQADCVAYSSYHDHSCDINVHIIAMIWTMISLSKLRYHSSYHGYNIIGHGMIWTMISWLNLWHHTSDHSYDIIGIIKTMIS
jgi:hypothetical protein